MTIKRATSIWLIFVLTAWADQAAISRFVERLGESIMPNAVEGPTQVVLSDQQTSLEAFNLLFLGIDSGVVTDPELQQQSLAVMNIVARVFSLKLARTDLTQRLAEKGWLAQESEWAGSELAGGGGAPTNAPRPPTNPVPNSGGTGLVVHYEPPSGETHRLMESMFKQFGFLELIASFFNSRYRLPRQVTIALAEINQVNAVYVPDHHAVIIGYELIDHFFEQARMMGLNSQQQAEFVTGAVAFVTFHELGHALVGEWDLPVTGKEEDAVDDFSGLLMIEFGEVGQTLLANASLWFKSSASGQGGNNVPYWDEHSLSSQRFYNILLLLYGANPQQWGPTLASVGVPQARLAKASHEFVKKKKAWDFLLKDYRK